MNAQELQQLQQLLTAFLSPENTIRSSAERTIDQNFDQSSAREKFIAGLLQVLRTSTVEQLRSLAAVLLRKKLPTGEVTMFEKLNETLQETLKTELMKAVTNETSRTVRRQLCDTIADLAECLLFKDKWPALVPFLFKCIQDGNDPTKISALSIFGKLFDTQYDYLESKLGVIRELYARSLQNTNLLIRTEAVFTLCRTLSNVDDEKEMKSFQQFIPVMLKTLAELFREKDTHNAMRVLSGMVELASECSSYFRPQLADVSKAMLQIGQNNDLEDGLRQLAMELLISLCEENASMIRKFPVVLQAAITLAFSLMLTIEDDEEWCSVAEAPDLFDGSNMDCGELAIDRIAQSLGGKRLIPTIFPVIADFLKRDDWKFRHAALRGLAQAGEVAELKQLPVKDVIGFVKDKNPRVRFGAIHCLGQLANDHEPDIQQQFHQQFIPAMVETLGDTAHPRNQSHAASALCNFLVHIKEDRDGDLLGPYVDPTLKILGTLLQNPSTPRVVLEQVMTVIAAVAQGATSRFKKYYPLFVPILKKIIKEANAKDVATLRSRAMECVTFIGTSVGQEMFLKDAREIVQIFLEIMKRPQPPDDTNMQFMLQAWTRICSVLGKEFIPCLPYVMPYVFKQASKMIETNLFDRNKETDIHTPDALRGETRIFSSALEEKATACSMICSFVHDLHEDFYPYLKEAASIMIPLMDYYLNDDVRNFAISSMPDMMACCVGTFEKKKCDSDAVRSLFLEITKKIISCFKTEPDTDILQTMVGSLQMCVAIVGDLAKECLDKSQLGIVGEALLKLLKSSNKRIASREERKKKEDFDEESLQALIKENEEENELNFMVSECIGALIQSHKEEFLPTFETVLPEIIRMMDPSSPVGVIKIALFIVDDVVEHLGTACNTHFKHFVPAFLAYAQHENVDLRQAAGYGIGMCAQHGKQAFQPYVDEAVKRLLVGINAPGSRNDDNASVTDNMITAIGRIAVFQNRPQLLPMWLNMLPILQDEDEAQWAYGQLLTLVEQNNVNLLGQNLSNLPKVIKVFVEVLSTLELLKTTNEDIINRMLAIINRLKSMPSEAASGILSSLSPKHREALQLLMKTSPTTLISSLNASGSGSSSSSSSSSSGSSEMSS